MRSIQRSLVRSGVVLKQKGLCCRKYMDHAFNHAHFCMYDNNVRVKTVYLKVLKKEESKYRVAHSSS